MRSKEDEHVAKEVSATGHQQQHLLSTHFFHDVSGGQGAKEGSNGQNACCEQFDT